MSLKYLTQRTAFNATTKNPVTTNFNHLRGFPRSWLIRRSKHDPKLKSVRPADRIKWWNIVPGDQIRLRGDPEATVHEVLSINRLSNRVFLKNTTTATKDDAPPQSKNVHYSRCQLYIGERDLPTSTGEQKVKPVFASRIGTSKPQWDRLQKRWVWRRYAVATTPKLPNWVRGQKLRIKWPQAESRKFPDAGLYDTPIDEVAKLTYQLPTFDPTGRHLPPKIPSERGYLYHVYNGGPYDKSASYEAYLNYDLSNPHSRAKKLKRWQVYQASIHATLKKITQEELEQLGGRSERQAKADAAFKWRELVKEEQNKTKKARWVHRAQEIKIQRRRTRKATKEARLRRRLTELVLETEPNQVIPQAVLTRQRVPETTH